MLRGRHRSSFSSEVWRCLELAERREDFEGMVLRLCM